MNTKPEREKKIDMEERDEKKDILFSNKKWKEIKWTMEKQNDDDDDDVRDRSGKTHIVQKQQMKQQQKETMLMNKTETKNN